MSEKLLAPTVSKMLAELARRISILERRVTTGAATSTTVSHVIGFSYAGALAASTSPPVRVWRGGNLAVLAVSFGTAGSTSTTIQVKRNGTTVATVVVPASTTVYNAEVSARFVADSDILTLSIATAGTGAADMTAEARFT